MNSKILKLVTAFIAVWFAATTVTAQEKTMYVMKNNAIVGQYAVSDIDSIIFYEPTIDSDDPNLLIYDVGVVINGVKWATRNVDAPGTFAAKPEDPGMFYQWNCKIGWSSTNPMINSNGGTTWSNSDDTGITWEKANDPCPDGWRMPTRAEWESIHSVATWAWNDTGTPGRKITLVGSSEPALILPAVGYRNYNDGSLNDMGTGGYYWSSTVYGPMSCGLYFNSGYVDANSSSHYRAYGFSCRCVSE